MTDNVTLVPGTDNYCVMGNPIEHSLSPEIHSRFADQTGENIHYQAILVDKDEFNQALARFTALGGKGLSVTLPFKVDAFKAADELSDRARLAAAVNTLRVDSERRLYGDNTDGIGLVTDITVNHGVEIGGKDLLVLGAGGAVQGILGPLLDQTPHKLVIANRTLSKAEKLAMQFSPHGSITACGYSDLDGQSFDIVINGTSASLQSDVPPIPKNIYKHNALGYDLMYSRSGTVFQQWSRQHGAGLCLDGLGMLVEQAAEAFYLWRGVRPDTAPVIKQLRAK